MKLRVSAKSAAAQAVLADLATGSAAAPLIELYTGTIPADMGATITDTLLATFGVSATIGTESGGVIAFGTITGDTASASGLAGWARLLDGDGQESAYFTAGGSDAEMIVTDPNVSAGVPMTISLASISMGG